MRRALVVSLLVLAVACTDRTPSRTGDGGGIVLDRVDAAALSADDAGADPADAASTPRSDGGAAPPGDAAAPTSDASTTSDACDAPVADMRAELVPRCSTETRDCVAACGDAGCMRACVAADATPPWTMPPRSVTCEFCLAWQQKRCIDRSGCHAETAALSCCIAEHCPADGACATSTCAAARSAWETCATSTAATCLGAPIAGDYALCYPPG